MIRVTHPIILCTLALLSLPSSIFAFAISTTSLSPSLSHTLLPPSLPTTISPTPSQTPTTTIITTTTTTTTTSPPNPKITTPPSPENIASGFRQKWHIETYSTCVTWANGYTHCGMHAPVRIGGSEIAGAGRVGGGSLEMGRVFVVVGEVVGVLVLGGVMW